MVKVMFQVIVQYWDGLEIPMTAFTKEGFRALVESSVLDHRIKQIKAIKPFSEAPIAIDGEQSDSIDDEM
jgi:hypothetical protein